MVLVNGINTQEFCQISPRGRRDSSSKDSPLEGPRHQGNAPPKMIYPSKCLFKILCALNLNGRHKLQNFEFHLNWLCLPNEILLHPSEVEGIVSYLKNFANEMLPRDDSEKQLKNYGCAPIMCNNALAFMMILERDFAVADDCLTESNRLIDLCHNAPKEILHKHYLQGLFYIVKGLKIIVESHTGLLGVNFQEFLEGAVENFDDLPLKAQVAVHASKHFFFKLINRRNGQLKYKEIADLIFMDPNYFEWRLYQYLNARKERCQLLGDDAAPSAVEVESIHYAWNLAPYNPFSIAYMCLCLTDALKSHPGNDGDAPWVMIHGQWQFNSVEEVVIRVKEFCMRILKSNPQSVKISLLVADILGSNMPFKHRDVYLARECIFKAYRFGEKVSSKANQCLAAFMLRHIKTPVSSPKQCEELLERACNLNKRNTDALYQLFLVYLHQPKQCYQKIRMLFATHLTSNDLPEEFIQKLVFLKGCFHMMVGESEDAILSWISVYNSQGNRLDFSMLRSYSYVFRVYKWSAERLSLPFVISETNNFFLSLPTPTLQPSQSQSQAQLNGDDELIRKTKNNLMEMLQDQHQALNSDEYYQLLTVQEKMNSPDPVSSDQPQPQQGSANVESEMDKNHKYTIELCHT